MAPVDHTVLGAFTHGCNGGCVAEPRFKMSVQTERQRVKTLFYCATGFNTEASASENLY